MCFAQNAELITHNSRGMLYTKSMEQHPVPRQITTFEFKLIGFMTLKQFLYLLAFVPAGFVLWKIIPIQFVNIIIGAITCLIGVALAFLPVNDISLETWIRNFVKRLTSPTQYVYQKNNHSLYFLQDLYFLSDPHKVMAHIESKEKLAAYLAKTNTSAQQPVQSAKAANVQSVLNEPNPKPDPVVVPNSSALPRMMNDVLNTTTPHTPFFTGVVKNNRKIPLPGVLIYVKDSGSNTLRLLKTNPHGVFATYNPIPSGDYAFEVKDPKGGYFFDTMKLKVDSSNPKPFEFYSKELL